MAKEITGIIKLLQSNDFKGVSEAVDIAKGRNQYPRSWRQLMNTFKRNKRWQRKRY